MAIAIDIILIIVLIYSGYKGYKKGIVDILIKLGSIFITILLIWLFLTPITNWVMKSKAANNLKVNFTKKVEEICGKDGEKIEGNEEKGKDQSAFLQFVLKMKTDEYKKEQNKSFAEFAANKLTEIIIKGIVILVLFALFNLVIIIISKILTKTVNSFEVTSLLNAIGGMILNILKTFLIVYILIYTFKMIAPILPENTKDKINLNNTIIIKQIYNSDYLIKKIIGVTK